MAIWKDFELTSAVKGHEMSDHSGVRISNTVQNRRSPVIVAEGLTAEYSTGCTPTGEWFALGTIVREGALKAMPAWVVVGTGATVDDAVQNLTGEIRRQAHGHARA